MDRQYEVGDRVVVTEVGLHDAFRADGFAGNLIGRWVKREVWGLHGDFLRESNGFEYGKFLCENMGRAGKQLTFHAIKTERITPDGIARALDRGYGQNED